MAVIGRPDVYSVPAYVAADLAALRFAFQNDESFASAVRAVANEIGLVIAKRGALGIALDHELRGWRRSAFSSAAGGAADLRLVFRAREGGGFEVLMFGSRWGADSKSIYLHAKTRA